VITPTTERSNEIIKEFKDTPFLKIVTLTHLVKELYEIYDERLLISDDTAKAVLFTLIKQNDIKYFDYVQNDSETLDIIYDFFIKLNSNGVAIDSFGYTKEKKDALETLLSLYQKYKDDNTLCDSSDILDTAITYIPHCLKKYDKVYIDSFKVGDIKLHKNKKEMTILNKAYDCYNNEDILDITTQIQKFETNLYHNEAFNNYDEVRTAIKIAKKLMLNGANEDDIVIVTSDFNEYVPFYYNLLDEYGMKGYDTIGSSLALYSTDEKVLKYHENQNVQKSYFDFKVEFDLLKQEFNAFSLAYDEKSLKERSLLNKKVRIQKEGILFTDINKLLGLQKTIKHIIFIGSDITHFPPKQSINFLYTQEQSNELFMTTSIFDSSKTLYDELKRLAENLYIVTASYSGKRKLVPSIIIDNDIKNEFPIKDIVSKADISKSQKRLSKTLNEYQKSILSEEFTSYDGKIESDKKFIQGSKLSASALNTYEKCPLQYYFNSILGLKAPKDEKEGFDAAQKGSLVHLCFELFLEKIKTTKNRSVDKKELYDLMLEISYTAYIHEETRKNIKEENINHKIELHILQLGLDDINSTKKQELTKFVDYYIEHQFEHFENSNAEELFMLDQDFKVIDLGGKSEDEIKQIDKDNRFIKGFIDRLDNLSKEVNIIDYKASLKSKNLKDFQEKSLKDYQLGIYMLYARQKYSDKTHNTHLLTFNDKDKTYNNTKVYLTDKEDHEVYKKNLYDETYETTLKQQILEIQGSITMGEFSFNNSDEKTCEFCNYKHICHQNILNKTICKEES
jgi:RecB family exonuclease